MRGLFPIGFVALQSTVDDVYSCAKALKSKDFGKSLSFCTVGLRTIDLTKKSTYRDNSIPPFDLVGLPGSIDNVQHAGFRRLGRGVEPGGGGQVEPGVRHKVRVVQKQPSVLKHGLAELAVVEVVAELLGSSSKIFPPLAGPERNQSL